MEKDIISSEDNGAQVRHPVLGPIVILVASKPIAKEEEVTAKKSDSTFNPFLLHPVLRIYLRTKRSNFCILFI